MASEAFQLAAFLNKLVLMQFTWHFTAVPALLYLNPNSMGEKGWAVFAALSLTFLSLERQYLMNQGFALSFLCAVMLY